MNSTTFSIRQNILKTQHQRDLELLNIERAEADAKGTTYHSKDEGNRFQKETDLNLQRMKINVQLMDLELERLNDSLKRVTTPYEFPSGKQFDIKYFNHIK